MESTGRLQRLEERDERIMLKGNRKKYFGSVIVLAVFYVIVFLHSNTRLTYLEYKTVNEKNDTFIALNANGSELRQEFIMPYDIFDSIALQIGTFARDNNSTWQFSLMDSSGKTLYEDTDFRVILDLAPATKGHALILPKEHAANLYELPEEDASKVLVVAKKVAAMIMQPWNRSMVSLRRKAFTADLVKRV